MESTLSHFLIWLVIVLFATPIAIYLPPWLAQRYGGSVANIIAMLWVQVLVIAAPFFYIWFLTGKAFLAPFIALALGLVGTSIIFRVLVHELIGAKTVEANMRKGFLLGYSEPAVRRAVQYARATASLFGFAVLGYFSYAYFTQNAASAAEAMLGVFLYSAPVITLLTSNVVFFFFVALPWIDDNLRFYNLLDAIFVGLVPVAMQALVAIYTLHGDSIEFDGCNLWI